MRAEPLRPDDVLSIGDLAARTGLSVSTIRYYEGRGLLAALRSPGGQRRFRRSDIRRLSFIRIAQQLGLSIEDIAAELARLPKGRTPTASDWAEISRMLKSRLSAEIDRLARTREVLDGCIGCGCLSLKKCRLFNPDDRASRLGPGPRFTMGDSWRDAD
ncbi:MAG: redox-sensitive transcriptional activator SoxR [Hyphomonadaceae bacterium]